MDPPILWVVPTRSPLSPHAGPCKFGVPRAQAEISEGVAINVKIPLEETCMVLRTSGAKCFWDARGGTDADQHRPFFKVDPGTNP